MTSYITRPYTLPACPCASSMKWRKSVGPGANAWWSMKPSRDWFIANTSLAILVSSLADLLPLPRVDIRQPLAVRGGRLESRVAGVRGVAQALHVAPIQLD